MKKPILSIDNLTVSYPGVREPAIENVSFTVIEGTITMLIGPNGSGKTTILKAILGLIRSTGKIEVDGQGVQSKYQQIGYVPQRFSFDTSFPITVSEFIALPGNPDELNIQKILSEVKLSQAEDHQLSSLSGGQLQRVLLARELLHQPKILLLDEPEAGVDIEGEEVFYHLIDELVQNHQMTALIVSHELDLVYKHADQVVCVNKQMVCRGNPEDVLTPDVFSQLYRHQHFYKHRHSQRNHE